ncbi:hypothetical protein [Xanthomonas hortorum]|uniref:hypothetical protein n=1 Tax=Xanthomonas hortorum TaxID=56454 RepID=UPI001593F110|nr:hypothetical protein [Xanthomonas hortorum]NHF67474.1 hypothetical protein [Xanthomonas hortorum]
MHWLMTPMDRHSDDGFGAMATAFKASAETLLAAEKDSMAQRELPTCFLLRHAAELFLKSTLVVSHRAFTLEKKSYPTVLIDGKDKPLTNVHGLGPLYRALTTMLTKHQIALAERARTSWLPMPVELDEAIALIDEMDRKGVFFRYPTEINASKSTNKPMTTEQMAAWDKDKQGYLKAFVVFDQNDEVKEIYKYDPNLLTNELQALKLACEWLNSFHVGLRMELAAGW